MQKQIVSPRLSSLFLLLFFIIHFLHTTKLSSSRLLKLKCIHVIYVTITSPVGYESTRSNKLSVHIINVVVPRESHAAALPVLSGPVDTWDPIRASHQAQFLLVTRENLHTGSQIKSKTCFECQKFKQIIKYICYSPSDHHFNKYYRFPLYLFVN